MPKKHSYEYVKKCFEDRGFTLLSEDYLGANKPLKYICDKGHEGTVLFTHFKKNTGCAKCSGNKKYNIVEINNYFKLKGCILLSTEYKNAHQHLEYICSEGHYSRIKWNHFQQGRVCGKCKGYYKNQEEKEVREVQKRLRNRLSSVLCDINKGKNVLGSCSGFVKNKVLPIYHHIGRKPEGEYDIDHIVPISYFDLRNAIELEACFRPINHRWLASAVNASRGDRLTFTEITETFSPELFEVLRVASRKPKKFEKYFQNAA